MHRLSTFPVFPTLSTKAFSPPALRPFGTFPAKPPPRSFLEPATPTPQAGTPRTGAPLPRTQATQTPSHGLIQQRLRNILRTPALLRQCQADTLHTFAHIGLSPEQSREMWDFVVRVLGQDRPLQEIEQQIFTRFSTSFVRGDGGQILTLSQSIDEKLAGRADIIYGQIKPFLPSAGKLLDFGCGDGQVTQRIQDQYPQLVVCGVDVADYKAPSVSVPIGILVGSRVPATSGTVDCIVATNVLHHEANNQQCLAQMQRLVTPDGQLIIIETVPVGATPKAIEQDHERTFWNDLIYNRWFHTGDIPVPGTYETQQGWVARFERMGFQAVHDQNLGVDQPTIQDVHVLQVYVLGKDLRLIKRVEQAFSFSGQGGDLKREREAMGEWFSAHPAFSPPIRPFVSALCDIQRDLPPGENREREIQAARAHTLEQLQAQPLATPDETAEATQGLCTILQKVRADAVRV